MKHVQISQGVIWHMQQKFIKYTILMPLLSHIHWMIHFRGESHINFGTQSAIMTLVG